MRAVRHPWIDSLYQGAHLANDLLGIAVRADLNNSGRDLATDGPVENRLRIFLETAVFGRAGNTNHPERNVAHAEGLAQCLPAKILPAQFLVDDHRV